MKGQEKKKEQSVSYQQILNYYLKKKQLKTKQKPENPVAFNSGYFKNKTEKWKRKNNLALKENEQPDLQLL